MKDKYYKMVAISDKVSIRVPKGLTPEREAKYIAEYKTVYMADFEKEYKEWQDMVEGKVPLHSMEEILRLIDEDEQKEKKESA